MSKELEINQQRGGESTLGGRSPLHFHAFLCHLFAKLEGNTSCCCGVSLWGGAVQRWGRTGYRRVRELLHEASISADPSGHASRCPSSVPSLPGGLWRCLLACQDLSRRCQLLRRLSSFSVLLPLPVVQPTEMHFVGREGHLSCGHRLASVVGGSSPASSTNQGQFGCCCHEIWEVWHEV